MNFFWIYDIPNWLFLLICITFFSSFSLLGALLFRSYFEKWFGVKQSDNEVVANFLSVSGVFYGITLGLIAVGSFSNFQAAESIVSDEASIINSLYRDISLLSGSEKTEMKAAIKEYAVYTAGEGWRLQQQGILPGGASKIVDHFQYLLQTYHLEDDKDKIIFQEVFSQLNRLSEKRRMRLNYVLSGLPSPVWMVVFLGAFIIIFLTWLLVIRNKKLDILINVLSGALLGTLVFLIAAMDYPFRGEFSVSPAPYQLLLDGIMKTG